VNEAIDGRFIPKVAGCSLYDGLSGIALSFLYLGHVLNNRTYTDMAHAALNEALSLVPKRAAKSSLGAFDGLGGLIYALSHASACSGDPKWLGAAKQVAHSALDRINEEDQLDVVSGHAGFIACLVALLSLDRDTSIVRIAKASANALVNALHDLDDLEAHTRFRDVNFAHGRAGIGWALLILDRVCGDPAYRTLGRDLILQDLNSWRPELFKSTLSASLLAPVENGEDHLAWCSGPLGIILSLISYNETVGTISTAAIARALIKGLRPSACKGRLALCHGDLGNVELILEATRRGILDNPSPFTEFRQHIVDRLRSDSCKQDLSVALDCPGLMTGHAGVIYGLLRASFPEDVPSVLVLEPPVGSRWFSQ
jgi:lantibiotic modifying enzyme